MKSFDRTDPATILTAAPRTQIAGDELSSVYTALQFVTFEEAVRHFMTVMPDGEKALSKIIVQKGDDTEEEWFEDDVKQIFDPNAKAGA